MLRPLACAFGFALAAAFHAPVGVAAEARVAAELAVERGGLPASPARGLVPGEAARLHVRVRAADGTAVALDGAELVALTPGVSVVPPRLAPPARVVAFEVRVDAAVPCGSRASFTLVARTGGDTLRLPLEVRVGDALRGPARTLGAGGPAALAARGDGFVALTGSGSTVLRLDATGALAGTLGDASLAAASDVVAGADGAVAVAGIDAAGRLVAQRVDRAAAPQPLCADGARGARIAALADGGFAVAYFAPAAGAFELRLARLTPEGLAVAAPETLATGLANPGTLAVAGGSREVAVLFSDAEGVSFVVSGEAGASAAARLADASAQGAVALAASVDVPGTFLLAYATPGGVVRAEGTREGVIAGPRTVTGGTTGGAVGAVELLPLASGALAAWSDASGTWLEGGVPVTGPAGALRGAGAAGARLLAFRDGAGVVRVVPIADGVACTASPQPLQPLADADNDGYEPPADCDDNNPDVNPGAAELCNDVDDDCDGSTDEDLPLNTYYADADTDGHGDPGAPVQDCALAPPAGTSASADDCNDANGAVHPGAAELCNDVDDDCDGSTDEDLPLNTYYADADTDGYGDPGAPVQDCALAPPAGTSANAADCNDASGAVNPGATELCNAVDDDCDGSTDEDLPLNTYYADADADGYGNPGAPLATCAGLPPAGYAANAADCNDANGAIHPGAAELCNAVDDDCDGSTDEDLPQFTFYADADGDTFGDPAAPFSSCVALPGAGHVDNALDCNDASPAAYPGALELCDTLDNDCDASVDELVGERFVAPGGVDGLDACVNAAAPCATITYAARAACLGETVRVAEGEYVEDVLLDRAVSVASQGIAINTQLRGTGAQDVLRILAGGVSWNGIEIGRTPGRACLRIGSAATPGVRDVTVTNAALYGCRVGAIVDSTGMPAAEGGWNRLLGVDVRDNVADGTPDSGVGILVVGGNGRLEVKTGRMVNNAGPGLRIVPPPVGAENRSIVVAGEYVYGNGLAGNADGRAGIEARQVFDLRLEGNDIAGHAGLGAADDGRGAWLDAVTGATIYCNRIRQNEGGVLVEGGSGGVDVRQNQLRSNGVFGLRVAEGSLAGMSARENIFAGNALAIDNVDPDPLDARRSWWNAADGSSSAGGSGDAFSGNVLAGDPVARAAAPLLVRVATNSGWDSSADFCFQRIQHAHDAAQPGDFLLVGPGVYPGRTFLQKPLEIEGVAPAPGGCSPSVMSAPQSEGSHLPAFRAAGVTGLVVRQLTIRDAGLGTACGQASGDEVGLDLLDVGQSSFRDICLRQNGVTELRVRGDSDGNLFENVSIDGVIRTVSGEDVCGHRSREGLLLDGWAACEGGAGASADGNAFRGFDMIGVTRGAVVRLASGTELSGSTLTVSRAPAWDGGGYAAGVLVEMADDTLIATSTMTSAEQTDGIRVSGRAAGSCVTERLDARRTTISGNTIRHAGFAGIRNFRNGAGSGAPRQTLVTCNTIRESANGLLTDFVGAGADAAAAHGNDFVANVVGVRNIAVDALDASGNWWGATNGPGGAGSGSGDAVFGAADFSGWLGSSGQDDGDADGVSECGGDCDDRNGAVFGGARELCADAVDNNCNGAADLADAFCAALDVQGLRFQAPSSTTLAWDPAPGAQSYGVQRGAIGPGPWGGYDHTCLASQLPGPTVTDPALPAAGRAFYYLATGQVADAFGIASGPLGTDSSGAVRPDAHPCP